MKLKILIITISLLFSIQAKSIHVLIPMDDSQKNHLKAYGIGCSKTTLR